MGLQTNQRRSRGEARGHGVLWPLDVFVLHLIWPINSHLLSIHLPLVSLRHARLQLNWPERRGNVTQFKTAERWAVGNICKGKDVHTCSLCEEAIDLIKSRSFGDTSTVVSSAVQCYFSFSLVAALLSSASFMFCLLFTRLYAHFFKKRALSYRRAKENKKIKKGIVEREKDAQ